MPWLVVLIEIQRQPGTFGDRDELGDPTFSESGPGAHITSSLNRSFEQHHPCLDVTFVPARVAEEPQVVVVERNDEATAIVCGIPAPLDEQWLVRAGRT